MALVTVEGVYKDGKVELTETPVGLANSARVLVTFLPGDGTQLAATEDSTEKEESREELLARIFARMEKGIDLGGPPYPKREELYDRLNRFE